MWLIKWVTVDDTFSYHPEAELCADRVDALNRKADIEDQQNKEVQLNGKYPVRLCSEVIIDEININ